MQDFLFDITIPDLSILLGDLVIDASDGQHQNDLLLTEKGAIKESMDCGVGIMRFVEGEAADDMLIEIRRQYTADGMTVKNILYNQQTGKLQIDASYNAI